MTTGYRPGERVLVPRRPTFWCMTPLTPIGDVTAVSAVLRGHPPPHTHSTRLCASASASFLPCRVLRCPARHAWSMASMASNRTAGNYSPLARTNLGCSSLSCVCDCSDAACVMWRLLLSIADVRSCS